MFSYNRNTLGCRATQWCGYERFMRMLSLRSCVPELLTALWGMACRYSDLNSGEAVTILASWGSRGYSAIMLPTCWNEPAHDTRVRASRGLSSKSDEHLCAQEGLGGKDASTDAPSCISCLLFRQSSHPLNGGLLEEAEDLKLIAHFSLGLLLLYYFPLY